MLPRVTHIYRRANGVWCIVHRHADPRCREDDSHGSPGIDIRVILRPPRATRPDGSAIWAVNLPPRHVR